MFNFLQWLKLKPKYIRFARITYAERKATEIKLGKILEIRIVKNGRGWVTISEFRW